MLRMAVEELRAPCSTRLAQSDRSPGQTRVRRGSMLPGASGAERRSRSGSADPSRLPGDRISPALMKFEPARPDGGHLSAPAGRLRPENG
jgi:hypothetical protein